MEPNKTQPQLVQEAVEIYCYRLAEFDRQVQRVKEEQDKLNKMKDSLEEARQSYNQAILNAAAHIEKMKEIQEKVYDRT